MVLWSAQMNGADDVDSHQMDMEIKASFEDSI
jgi:hypothetical protein